jgi:hypothetical protein
MAVCQDGYNYGDSMQRVTSMKVEPGVRGFPLKGYKREVRNQVGRDSSEISLVTEHRDLPSLLLSTWIPSPYLCVTFV